MAFNTQIWTWMAAFPQAFSGTGGGYSTKTQDDTYNPRYPWFNKENYERLERKVSALWLTWNEKLEVMDQFYRQILPQVEEEKKKAQRSEILNQKKYNASQITDEAQRKVANHTYTVEELAQKVKEKEHLREDAPDADVFNTWMSTIPNGEELLGNYMNKGDKELLYVWGLEERPKRTAWDKAEEFAVWVAQSPGKWWYNIIGQWMDRAWKAVADKLQGTDLANFVQNAAIDVFWEDEVKAYQEQKQKELEDKTAFKWRVQTDITEPLLWEERAKSWWTKAWEVVWDIASWIALTAPAAAVVAPYYWSMTVWQALTTWGIEWILDTALTKYWSTWEWATVWELALWWILWAWWGLLSRYLQTIPKTKSDTIRKEAETYINKSIKPTVKGKTSQADYNQFIDDTLDVTNFMNKNKGLIEYTDDAWEVVKGKLPTNLRETSESLWNLKRTIYEAYNDIAKQAWDKGARVNMNQAFDKLDDLLKDPSQNIANSQTKAVVENFKNSLLDYTDDAGTIWIEDAQKLTQEFNNQLKTFFRNPNMNDVSKSSIVAKLNKWTKDAINNSIDDALDDGINAWSRASNYYKDLKQMYGKILTIEDEISKRALTDARKNTKWLTTTVLDALAWWEATDALLTIDPAKLGKATVMKAVGKYYKYLNDPNVQINNLFKLVEKTSNNGSTQWIVKNVVGNVTNSVKQAWRNIVQWATKPNVIATTSEVLTND